MAEKKQIEKHIKNSPLTAFLLFGAVTLWALPTAFFQVCTLFPPYDDEGYLMITVKQFVEGNVLYNQVYTQYGAAYYFFQWLLHGLLNLPVTHNVTRLTTLFVWILISILCGVFAYRLTRSAIGGAAAYILAFLILFRMTYEPGHPQEFCGLLLIVSLLLLTGKNVGKIFTVQLFLLGITVALLNLTKINLGIFLDLALAVSFVSLSPKNRFQRFWLIFLTFLCALLPFILFRKFLDLGWFRLSLLIAVGMSATLITSLRKTNVAILNTKHYFVTLMGFCLTIIVVSLAVILQGSTFEAFLDGIFFQHLKFGDMFAQSAPIQRFASSWAIFAFFVACVFLYIQRKKPDSAVKLATLLKFLFGIFVILSSFLSYFSFLNVFVMLSFATPFLWILLLNSSLKESAEQSVFPRIALVIAATLQPLQIFPIAGTQMNFGSFLMLIIAVVCVFDAASEQKTAFPKIFSVRHLQTAFAIAFLTVLVGYSGYRTFHVYKIYQSQIPLSFKGAEFVRLPEEDFALYNFLVENIKNNCDDFMTVPGINSLYFWTGIKPPTTFNATAVGLLNNDRQEAVIREVQKSSRGCSVSTSVYGETNAEDTLTTNLMIKSLRENYKKAAEWRGYQLRISKGNFFGLTYYANFSAEEPETIEFRMPTGDKREIFNFQIYDWEKKEILADGKNRQFTIIDSTKQKKHLRLLQGSLASIVEKTNPVVQNNLLLRLLDSEGKLIASLPFIAE
jgi:hypothetical protein